MIAYSEDQARAFVTDAGTWQRGQHLAQPAKWDKVGRTATTAWGECAGSGAKPYLTGIDLREPAFKCSCPSRVFPCKHGAGLLLLLARQPTFFAAATPPQWLEEWLAKRAQTPTKKADKTAPPTPAPSAGAAAAEPAPTEAPGDVLPARLGRMAQGIDELEAWLLDLVRHGLAALDQQPASFWHSQAARLVDNQLPGLAASVRELATLRHAFADWPARLAARLGELYWLVQAFQNRAQLAPAAWQEVLQQVGVAIKKEALPAHGAPVADTWQVLGQFSWEEDRLTARRSWLRGQASGRHALVLEFVFGGQRFATPLVPHGQYAGDMLFYPGPLPLRAAPGTVAFVGSAPPHRAPPAQRPSQLLGDYARALARQPWLREWPAALGPVLPVRQPAGHWLLACPAEAGALPLRFAQDEEPWHLLAASGGRPLTLFGEWDGRAFRPLGSWPWLADGEAMRPPTQLVTAASPWASLPAAPAPGAAPAAPRPGEFTAADYPAFSQLLRIALLGTYQSGEVVPALPGAAPPIASPEQRLLLGVGTLALLQKAGFNPPASVAPPAPAPAETWQPLGPLGTECFRALLDGAFSAYQTDYWTQLVEHQRLIPASLLVPALNYGRLRQHLPGSLSALLGERGQWLAQQNPDWHPVLASQHPSQDEAIWETGALPQRKFFIQLLHKADPERARQLLAAALPTEPAATQAALLSELAHSLTAADAPLLTPYLTAKSKEVRQVVAPLLVRLPGSALVAQLWQRAAPLLALKRPLLGQPKLQVALPEHWDKTWQAEGIEQKTSSFDGGERAGWLGQLLALLPPSRWAAHLGTTPTDLVALAEATEWKTLLLRAWARAAYLHQDKAFAPPLLLRHFAQPQLLLHPQATHLTWLLTDAEKLALLRAQLPPQASELPAFLPAFLEYLLAPWPADMVAASLRFAAERLAPFSTTTYGEPYQRLSSLLHRLAKHLPDDQLPRCREALEPLASQHAATVAPLVEQFFEAVRFRQQLAASLIEPSTPSLF